MIIEIMVRQKVHRRITVRWASTSVPTRRLRLVEKTKHYCITKYKLPLLGSWRSETATEGE